MILHKFKEGNIEFYAPLDKEGKVSTELPVFYNPDKVEDRDICESLIKAIEPKRALDLLAGTGVRGIRIASLGIETTINDWNKDAHALIERNVKLNKVNAIIRNENAHHLLTEGTIYDYIDIDPYGSPLPFVDSSLKSLRNRGYLGVCATDTGALAGSFPKVCFRRYGSKSLKTFFYAESGVRVLIKKIIEIGAQYEYAMTPVYAHLTIQGYRVYFKKEKGSTKTDNLLKLIGNVDYCKKHGCVHCDCNDKITYGPLFKGEIWDKELSSKIKDTNKMTSLIHGETGYLPFHYDIGKLASSLKVNEPRFDDFLKRVSGVRTHFSKKGFRSDTKFEKIIKEIKNKK